MSYPTGTHVRTFLIDAPREEVTSSPVFLVVRESDGEVRVTESRDYLTAQREDIPRAESYGAEVLMVIEGESSAYTGMASAWVRH